MKDDESNLGACTIRIIPESIRMVQEGTVGRLDG